MKKTLLFLLSIAFLLFAVGCSNVEEPPPEVTPDSVVEEEQTYHFTAELIKYGNDAFYVKVTDAGDSTLSIGDELYVSMANAYDDYPIGCTVEVVYDSNATIDDYGIFGNISISKVQ